MGDFQKTILSVRSNAPLNSGKCEEVGESPDFDVYNIKSIDSILLWANAKVVWDEGILVDGEGNEIVDPRFAGWSLSWPCGCMQLCASNSPLKGCDKARKTAALFIYLWTRGVEVSIAIRCAESYPL